MLGAKAGHDIVLLPTRASSPCTDSNSDREQIGQFLQLMELPMYLATQAPSHPGTQVPALATNGSRLQQNQDREGPFRSVFPCDGHLQ
jgi:hypothetical protein